MRRQFGKTIVELAAKDPKLVLFYGDVKQNMDEFERRFPDRIFNVGICEQSTVSMAAGMALEGLHPVVYSLTPFLIERNFEQWKMDVDAMNLPVIGIGYSFYPTHGPSQTALEPEVLISCFNNIRGCFPKSSAETDYMMRSVHASGKPAIICLSKDLDL